MAPSVDIVPATVEHAKLMAPNMRDEDAAEVLASGGYSPLGALVASLRISLVAKALLINGEVACLWGVAPLKQREDAGVVWLLGSKVLCRYPKLFVKLCRSELKALLAEWPLLLNYVDARYEKALRWATWLGFNMSEPEPFGAAGMPFRVIAIGRAC